MNYYEHHLGDWAAATGHLSWDEDLAYTRLLRAYYHGEQPIAEGQQYRLARAATPNQRKAVDAVLREFFTLADGFYRQKRADEEIARFQDKQRKAKEAAAARWSQCKGNADADADASPPAMRTHSGGNALQSPVSSLQTPGSHASHARTERASQPAAMTLAEFQAIKTAYPAGTYRDADWLLAERAVLRILSDQLATLRELELAAAGYRAQQEAKGSTGTQFVLSPRKFFEGGAWRGPFTLPAPTQRKATSTAERVTWRPGPEDGGERRAG